MCMYVCLYVSLSISQCPKSVSAQSVIPEVERPFYPRGERPFYPADSAPRASQHFLENWKVLRRIFRAPCIAANATFTARHKVHRQ